MKVIGIGQQKTPLPFITACNKFVYLEILKAPVKEATEVPRGQKVKPGRTTLNKVDQDLIRLLKESVAALADENGWTFLGELGNFILKKKADFDPRNYGFLKLLPLIKSTRQFEIDERETSHKNIKHIFVRIK